MKNTLLIGFIFLFIGCESDFDLIHDGDPIPIVYCLLDPGEKIQTIRLTKTFVSDQGRGLPDSVELIYYQTQVNLAIEKMDGDQAIDHTEFDVVTVQKEPGLFSDEYHIVYQANMKVTGNSTYRLIIYIPEEDKLIYSYTKTPGDFSLIDPAYPNLRSIHLMPDHNPVFHWTQAENAIIYQLCLQLNYYEIDSLGTSLKSEVVSLNTLIKNDNPGNYYVYDINSTQFYIALGNSMKEDLNLLRAFHSLDAFVVAGGSELAIHYQTQHEGDPFRIMDFTNIQNGIGVFSSISYSYTRGFKVTNQTIDSLAYGQFTKQLNFLDRDGNRKDQ